MAMRLGKTAGEEELRRDGSGTANTYFIPQRRGSSVHIIHTRRLFLMSFYCWKPVLSNSGSLPANRVLGTRSMRANSESDPVSNLDPVEGLPR